VYIYIYVISLDLSEKFYSCTYDGSKFFIVEIAFSAFAYELVINNNFA
jgi:hypothetical protein